MIVTSSTADRDQRRHLVLHSMPSCLSGPLCWQCDTSVDGRSAARWGEGGAGCALVSYTRGRLLLQLTRYSPPSPSPHVVLSAVWWQ